MASSHTFPFSSKQTLVTSGDVLFYYLHITHQSSTKFETYTTTKQQQRLDKLQIC
jgi:hypothetical protein